jgi:hypothetical protein
MVKPEGTKFTMKWDEWRIVSAPGGVTAVLVVAGNIDNRSAVSSFPQDFLDHVIVCLRPKYPAPERPDVEAVADKVEFFELVSLEETEELCRLAASCAKMHIRNPSRPVTLH